MATTQQHKMHSLSYYSKCVMGGLLACGTTHTLMCPLDLVKCRKQVDPKLYKSIGDGFKTVYKSNGFKANGLFRGWLPTLFGYSMQGIGKFGFYEIFKDVYAHLVGEESARKHRVVGWLACSAAAEFIADLFLCPMESIKVRIQTSLPEGSFTHKLGDCFNLIKKNEGLYGFYKGIAPLWFRQIPYTMMKFACFEKTVSLFYTHLFTKPKNQYNKATQLSVTFMSGYIAGIFCAIVSHPADTIVSKLNQMKTSGSISSSIGKIYKEIGFTGVWRGLIARIIMIGTLTGLQWWIYDSFKAATGLATTGGK